MPADDEALIPIEKPTGLHRYVLRHETLALVPGTNILSADRSKARRIHQQQWSVITFDQGSNGAERLEWRDVPLVDEDRESISEAFVKAKAEFPELFVSEEVLERRRRGLPDYPKPPLGQPPAFLQEQERSDRAAVLGDAGLRMRLDASIRANEAMLERLQKMRIALEWIVRNGDGSHPSNIIKVAQEGLPRKGE
jgi:hypothetical protein